MGERLCLRCDWTGEADGRACPRCDAPLYRMRRPEPTTGVAPAPSRSPPDAPTIRRLPAVEGRAEEHVPAAMEATAGGRRRVIVLAIVIASAAIAFALLGRTAPQTSDALGQGDAEAPTGARPSTLAPPSVAAPPPPDGPAPCGDGPSTGRPAPPVDVDSLPPPTADYRFQGSLGSKVRAAPDLEGIGSGTTAFSDEGMIGRTVLTFGGGRGLALAPTTRVIASGRYTIALLFRFDRIDGFRKIVDFEDGSEDVGLYVLDGCLNLFPRPPRSPTAIEVDTYAQIVLTRDASATVVGYVDGVRQFAFRDEQGFARIGRAATLRFFVDDSVTGGEYSGGAVSQIRLYDRALTAPEVAALACAELRVPITTRACRDLDG